MWPWAVAVVVAVVVAAGAVAALVRWPRAEGAVAHSAWVRVLPVVRAAVRRQRVTQALGWTATVVLVVATAVLVGRPVGTESTPELMGRRDIVLCLDVSGSMLPFDTQILGSFETMVGSFDGERIALSVFNATSQTVFPLTDDYEMVLDELARVKDNLDVDLKDTIYVEDLERVLTPEELAGLWEVWAGTLSYYGSSLVGDGLASCSLLFDPAVTDRSRSIILATDNDVMGDPIYRLSEAAALADRRGASLYGLFPQENKGTGQDSAFSADLGKVGGKVWYAEDPGAVGALVAEVVDNQRVVVASTSPPTLTDRQRPWTALAGLAVVALLGARVWGRR
ncbi:MAG: VWA domain-containing protein [Micrococcales bacterium]|nr:VWA domain-containing protein [Micrococcales bacterium]MCL2667845.1 VWA domain-containing protein [Micrococcales bacterium]